MQAEYIGEAKSKKIIFSRNFNVFSLAKDFVKVYNSYYGKNGKEKRNRY